MVVYVYVNDSMHKQTFPLLAARAQSIAVVDYQSQFELSWRSVRERCSSEGNLVDFQSFYLTLKNKNRVLRKS